MKSKLVKILFLCLCILAVICGCSNNNKDLSNNLSKQESPIPPGLKKFTLKFEYMDHLKLSNSDNYKVDITLPDNWTGDGDGPILDKSGIALLGFTSLNSIDDNYKFTNSSWKDFRKIDLDFDTTTASTGITSNGYEYTKYKLPNHESYIIYIKAYPKYATTFETCLDGINSTSIDEVLNSIYFYK